MCVEQGIRSEHPLCFPELQVSCRGSQVHLSLGSTLEETSQLSSCASPSRSGTRGWTSPAGCFAGEMPHLQGCQRARFEQLGWLVSAASSQARGTSVKSRSFERDLN